MYKKKYLLYGMGISNKSIKEYFDLYNIDYDIYIDKCCNKTLNLNEYDYIIKSPGIKNNTFLMKQINNFNCTVISDLELYSLFCKNDYKICITGSNGKTTTTTLLGDILSNFDVVGNIGIPVFSKINNNHFKIIECSSYMLEYTIKFRPNIFIILNIMPHHLDHHQTFNNYIDSKLKVLKNMKEEDILIYNLDDEIIVSEIKKYNLRKYSFSKKNKDSNIYLENNIIYYNNQEYLNINNLKLKGLQFIDDLLAVILTCKILKIEDELIISKLIKFQGLSHRFEIINLNNYVFINDSKSTSPFSLKEAIDNLLYYYLNRYKILIMGGQIINEDYSIILDKLKDIDKIYITGENKNKINKLINHKNKVIIDDLEEIIYDIKRNYKFNFVCLFSPGAPSLDIYHSFEERGNYFKLFINKYFKKE